MKPTPTILSFKYRIKDATTKKHLVQHAVACNQVWNYCCSVQREAEKRWKAGGNGNWPTAFDLIRLCTGSHELLNLPSGTINKICQQFVSSRNKIHCCPQFRTSFGPKRSLGWIPFIDRSAKTKAAAITFRKCTYRFWKSRELGGKFNCGCFVQDARGRWYVVFQCQITEPQPTGTGQIGIDLGLKTLATCSDGTKIPALRHFRRYQKKLAIAQRARNKKRVRAIHAKIRNSRRNHLHEWSNKLAQSHELIVVGNVSSTKLAKTNMAKSVLDASWGILKSQLRYKASRHGARFTEVDERWTTQRCSSCGEIPDSSPKGKSALGIRHWTCSLCSVSHDRDINGAINILNVGLKYQAPGEGILAFC